MLRSTRRRANYPASLLPMAESSFGDIAGRAGATQDYVSRLVELGVVSVGQGGDFTEGDVRRVRLMQTLERAGVPLEEVAGAIRRCELSLGFLDMSHFARLSSLTDVTFQELSDRTNVPVELLLVIREAGGFAEPQPTDRVRENELLIARLIEAQIAEGFRPRVIERWLRVYGDSLRRIAETEGDWWHTEVEVPLLESGMSPAEMMEAADGRAGQRIVPLLDRAIIALYHGHQEHAWTKNILDGIEAALSEAGVHSRLERPPAICFLDITGYTRLTEERGDEAAARARGNDVPDRATHVSDARREAHQVVGRRRDVPLPRAGAGRDRGARHGRGHRERRSSARPRRPARGTRPVPGGRLLRADCQRRVADR